ncbi:MAG: phage tail protein [Bacteroidales bacterium]
MSNYPLTTNHFQVEWGGTRISFSEVSGLIIENEPIEYREGASPEPNPVKMPGLNKFQNIVLKRGIVKGDNEFYQWIRTIQQGTVERRDVIISLLDEEHSPVVTWKVRNAWPIKYEGPVLKADANEVAIETLELVHEGLTILNE